MNIDQVDRVHSKHLFHFPLNGISEDAIMPNEDDFYESKEGLELFEMWIKMEDIKTRDDEEGDKDYVHLYRKSENLEWGQLGKHPLFDVAMNDCVEKSIKVPTSHCGQYEVIIYVYTSKKVLLQQKCSMTSPPALIYAHGGGTVASSAAIYKPWLVQLASNFNIVVFNVEYRLAPETKYPNNAKDFYECIKYVSRNSSKLGIDPARICTSGMSGGGYICLVAMILLAQSDESHIVKLSIPEIPMCSSYCFTDLQSMTKEERENSSTMKRIWRLLANDLTKDMNDPILFPDMAKDKLLMKISPTVIISGEFDIFLTETTRFANRLRSAGRLLEFIVFPGAKHSSNWYPKNEKSFALRQKTLQTIFNEYL